MKEAKKFELKVSGVSLDYHEMQKQKAVVVNRLVSGVEMLLKGNRVTILMGDVELVKRDTVVVTTASGKEEISTKNEVVV